MEAHKKIPIVVQSKEFILRYSNLQQPDITITIKKCNVDFCTMNNHICMYTFNNKMVYSLKIVRHSILNTLLNHE